MPFHNLEHSYSNNILLVHLNNQESQNAFSLEMAIELSELLYQEMPKALLLTNKGSSFCAGGNLQFYKNLDTKAQGLKVNKKIRKILEDIYSLPIPKACFVQGHCLGGGIELVSCFDHVVATPSSLFGMWQRRVGLSYGWGGGERLQKRIPAKKLEGWLFHGSTLDAYTASEMGLVDQVEMSVVGLEKSLKWLEQTMRWGEESFQKIKSQKKEVETFKSLWHSDRHKEVLNKFK